MKTFVKTVLIKNPNLYHNFASGYSRLAGIGQTVRGYYAYKKTERRYKKLNQNKQFVITWKYKHACLTDRYQGAGTLNAYFWQDLWGAKLIAENQPLKHYDIGSRVDGFIGHLASFRDNIYMIDVRPMQNIIPGVTFIQADGVNMAEEIMDGSAGSISALCSLEHFGLGRYGDEIDPDGCFKAMKSITRMLCSGGHAYISVPVGYEHLEFNAHRVFYAGSVIKAFAPLKLVEYSCTDGNGIERNVPVHKYDTEKYNMGGRFGLFHFVK